MNIEKYLPIGTVVMLENGKKRVMIIGFNAMTKEDKKIYDYVGCLYPEGVLRQDMNLLFNHEQVVKIYHVGLVDAEWTKLEPMIKERLKQKLSGEKTKVELNAENANPQTNMFSNQSNDLFN